MEAIRGVGGVFMRIGVVTSDPRIVLKEEDEVAEIPYRGWEHFKSRP